MKSKRLLTLLIAGIAASLHIVSAEQYTLEQCVSTALRNNLQVHTQQNAAESQRIQYKQAKQNLSPSVNGYASQSLSWGRSTGVDNISRSQNIANTGLGLNANLTLFDGLAMKFNIDQAKAQLNQSEASLEQIRLDITINITAMYLQVLLNKELEHVAEVQLEDTRRKVERAEALVRSNRLAQGELYTLEAQAAKEENSLIQAQNTTKLSLLDLAQAMELQYSPDFDIAPPQQADIEAGLLPDNNEVYNQALNKRPEIKAAKYNLSAQQIALKTAKAAYSPTLTFGAGVSTGYYHLYGADNAAFGKQLSDNFSTNIALNLNIPLFDRMRTPNNVKQQELRISNARIQLEQTKHDLRKKIDQAYYNAVAAHSRQQSAEKALISAQEAYHYAEQKYEAGRSTTYEFYEAKRTLQQAESEVLQSKYNYLFKLRILEYYSNSLNH